MFLPLLLLLFPAFLQGQSNDGTCSPNIYTVLSELEAKVNKLENHIKGIRQVAFSAALLASGESTTGPFSDFTTLIYKHVVTNVGNAYNSDTGFFTAPVKGAYHFEFYSTAVGGHTSAVLVKNGGRTFAFAEGQGNGFGTGSNAITLVLEVGDVVSINLWLNSVMYDNQNHHSTFSGHLLFTM
uniref:Complement C1q-like protein 2 n=1 Tax=Sphaeramia orbicularis TaxID=375764 RepID=A0A672Z1I3_9TELE